MCVSDDVRTAAAMFCVGFLLGIAELIYFLRVKSSRVHQAEDEESGLANPEIELPVINLVGAAYRQ